MKIYKVYKEYFKNLLEYKKQEINSFIEMTDSDFVYTVLIYCIERNCRTQKYFIDVLRNLIGKGIVTVIQFNKSIESYRAKKQNNKLNRTKIKVILQILKVHLLTLNKEIMILIN